MSKSAIKYVFILIGTLVLSLVLWNFFIGSGVSVEEGLDRGSRFEGFVWETAEPTLQQNWLRSTAYNGLLSEHIIDNTWTSAKAQSQNTVIQVKYQDGSHPAWYANHS